MYGLEFINTAGDSVLYTDPLNPMVKVTEGQLVYEDVTTFANIDVTYYSPFNLVGMRAEQNNITLPLNTRQRLQYFNDTYPNPGTHIYGDRVSPTYWRPIVFCTRDVAGMQETYNNDYGVETFNSTGKRLYTTRFKYLTLVKVHTSDFLLNVRASITDSYWNNNIARFQVSEDINVVSTSNIFVWSFNRIDGYCSGEQWVYYLYKIINGTLYNKKFTLSLKRNDPVLILYFGTQDSSDTGYSGSDTGITIPLKYRFYLFEFANI